MAGKGKRSGEVRSKFLERDARVESELVEKSLRNVRNYQSHSDIDHHIIPYAIHSTIQPGTEKEMRAPDRPLPLFKSLANFLDLLLEPEAAEEAIGNLRELYLRRLAIDRGHARRWLVAQFVWIVYGRAMDVFSRFMRARSGK